MTRKMLKSKIHRATVTGADLEYEGSITIDESLLEAADILPYEAVDIWNVTNGARFQTYAMAGKPGSGAICVNGAAARLVSRGDLIIIASWVELDFAEARKYWSRLVFVDERNVPTGKTTENPGQGDLERAVLK
jgi:aspartate 1-decarboxylase